EGTGACATLANTQVCSACVSTKVWLDEVPASPCNCRGRAAPSCPSKPISTGITKGSFSGWSAVAAQLCESVSVYVHAVGSYWPLALTKGVPDWLYQRLNCCRCCVSGLAGLASAMACTKSSHV